jgi:hypothetical protein
MHKLFQFTGNVNRNIEIQPGQAKIQDPISKIIRAKMVGSLVM